MYGSNFNGVKFIEKEANYSSYFSDYLTSIDFSNCKMIGTEFRNDTFFNLRFINNTIINHSIFTNSIFRNCTFENIQYERLDIRNSKFYNCKFIDIDFNKILTNEETIFDDKCVFPQKDLNNINS